MQTGRIRRAVHIPNDLGGFVQHEAEPRAGGSAALSLSDRYPSTTPVRDAERPPPCTWSVVHVEEGRLRQE